ncbi:hypothetical protein [Actinomyces lilanjuaniae]|uniref:hypothetical protein n=1 Tax=Actinomyces lilanjuaniae TaxID=2321394 RepID=UPI0013C3ED4F|nr:hypothetical protein [Actinomyces lilanjuaniae]
MEESERRVTGVSLEQSGQVAPVGKVLPRVSARKTAAVLPLVSGAGGQGAG